MPGRLEPAHSCQDMHAPFSQLEEMFSQVSKVSTVCGRFPSEKIDSLEHWVNIKFFQVLGTQVMGMLDILKIVYGEWMMF